jgi:hypothetical protein
VAVFSAHPISIDGVSLDSFAWMVESKMRARPALRTADVQISGVDGDVPSLNDDYEASTLSLGMFVRGSDQTGVVPAGTAALAKLRENLDTLVHLFSKTYALLDVQEDADGVGGMRRAYAKVVDVIEPELLPGATARFKVELKVPYSFWEDINPTDWTQTGVVSGTVYDVTTLQGATAPISDAIILFTGPGTNPEISDFTTHDYVRLNAALTSGQSWRINNRTWASQYGTLTLGSADASGSDGQAITAEGGGGARFLRLMPEVYTGIRKVRIAVTGTGFTSATSLSVRARRKFLQ